MQTITIPINLPEVTVVEVPIQQQQPIDAIINTGAVAAEVTVNNTAKDADVIIIKGSDVTIAEKEQMKPGIAPGVGA